MLKKFLLLGQFLSCNTKTEIEINGDPIIAKLFNKLCPIFDKTIEKSGVINHIRFKCPLGSGTRIASI